MGVLAGEEPKGSGALESETPPGMFWGSNPLHLASPTTQQLSLPEINEQQPIDE